MKELSNQSVSHSEFQLDGPISISAWYRINSWVPCSLCSFTLPNFQHKYSPYQHVGLQSCNTHYWCLFCEIQLFPQVLEDILEVSMVGDLHFVEFSIFDLPISGASWAWRFISPPQFPGAGRLSLSWEYIVGFRLMFRVSFLPPDETHLWSNSWFSGLFESLESCGGVFFAEPSFMMLSWTLLDMTHCFLL